MIGNLQITDQFWGRYQQLVREVVLPYQENVLHDRLKNVTESHAIANFRATAKLLKTGLKSEDFHGMVFQDSDVAKWLEAVAYSLQCAPDVALEARADEVINLIGEAQCPDGYLNTYFTLAAPELRWSNLQEGHELYCAGHMMEAAVAYYEATGKDRLLNIMLGMTDCIHQHFIVEQAEGYPGHPEIELALLRMYRATKEPKCMELAQHFINVRGVDASFFTKEKERRGWTTHDIKVSHDTYAQNHAPVREQTDAVGHAVRAVYLYTAMADLARETGDDSLLSACEHLWESLTQRQMYVTGGIGSTCIGEALTVDYDLPNDTAYSETCASVGLIFFARQMLEEKCDRQYSDVMERALYNCVLAGMQLTGQQFFYVNPLEVNPMVAGRVDTHLHVLPQRPDWFACACCPTNTARLLCSLQRYAWHESDDTVYFHLYIGGKLTLPGKQTEIQIDTDYPYGGQIAYTVLPQQQTAAFTLAIRVPTWSSDVTMTLNNTVIYQLENNGQERLLQPDQGLAAYRNGYVYISRQFQPNDRVVLRLCMIPFRVYANTAVSADSGRVAVQRGPFVYCLEGCDHQGDVLSLELPRSAEISAMDYDPSLLSGIVPLTASGLRADSDTALYSRRPPKKSSYTLHFVPYYAWGNRGENQMRVWLPEC